MSSLAIDRVFSSSTQPVFDQVSWTKRFAVITDDNREVFRQDDIDAPDFWTDQAVKIVASKYFYGQVGTDQRENSVKQLIHRVANTLRKWGVESGYFDEETSQVFYDELCYMCLHQYGAFNSPVWFNVGLWHEYKAGAGGTSGGWAYNFETGRVEQQTLPYLRPQGSACFIQSVEDNMDSILALAASEAMLFKFGSGTGTDLTPIRSSRERLSGGGRPSGPLSFLRVYDQVANVVKSGGKCLAPHQRVWTENGPRPVKALAESNEDFIILSFDPPANRLKAKWARAWKSGQKRVVRVETDKGHFEVSHDHPFRLSHGEACQASRLMPGMSIFAANTLVDDYVRVGFDSSPVRASLLHRMIMQDVLGLSVQGKTVHHIDGNGLNNSLSNLELLENQAVHAALHASKDVEQGTHPFQTHKFDVSGPNNGMHSSGDFHNDKEKVKAWKEKLGEKSKTYAAKAQKASSAQKILNSAYKLINEGHDISTPESYNKAMDEVLSRGRSHKSRNDAVDRHFGSHTQLLATLSERNHRVLNVVDIGMMDVYSVEVDCPTPDDKSASSGHNYAICSGDGLQQHLAFVFNTRRAAKMNTMRDWHPDIEEFILAKSIEEKKAHALIDSGYDGSFNGEAYGSVAFQNENLSVRVSDEFMESAIAGRPWVTRSVTTGEPMDEKQASKLLDQISESTWLCGDPGLQYDSTIQKWHTCKGTEPIHSTNPCSEYVFINNTACNLASLNLLKFKTPEGNFDIQRFKAACRIFIIAQDILVDWASYPTKLIAENSHIFRTLGLGYANLGSLIMSYGLPYDSEEGQAIAGSMASLMTSTAYHTSAELAKHLGKFPGYEDARCSHVKQPAKPGNVSSMLGVIRLHADKASERVLPKLPNNLLEVNEEAVRVWESAYAHGIVHGFRNAQVTVIAPTGTIAFMMGCDTTGIEPDIALVKYKTLAGGGHLKMINGTVPLALRSLGYTQDEIDHISDHIMAHDTIEDVDNATSGLRPEHLTVFDCAFKAAKGQRSISWQAHLRIMAAVQPFISGAISKTVNMPNAATVSDVRAAYVEAWRMGLKCVAIYRDGSKRSQPLNTSKSSSNPSGDQFGALLKELAMLKASIAEMAKPQRKRLGDTRNAKTHKFCVGGHEGYITIGLYADGQPGELFIQMAKEGSTMGGLMDTIATLTSISLQYGVPINTLTEKFKNQRFEPSGFTTNKQIPRATSIIDYVFRWIENEFSGDHVDKETPKAMDPCVVATQPTQPMGPSYHDGQCCSACGSSNVQVTGTCATCRDCGTSLGCS